MSVADCVFCKIVSGTIPCAKLFESADVLAFLDIGPLAPGHALVIPKAHFADILDVPEDVMVRIASVLPHLGPAVMRASGADGLNILQNTGTSSGQAVFHIHFHLIPRRHGDGLGYRWNAGKYDPGQCEAVQAKIVNALQSAG
jgi:histidine triad (HIT) family protein